MVRIDCLSLDVELEIRPILPRLQRLLGSIHTLLEQLCVVLLTPLDVHSEATRSSLRRGERGEAERTVVHWSAG